MRVPGTPSRTGPHHLCPTPALQIGPAGTASAAGASLCKTCPEGFYAPAGSSTCLLRAKGVFKPTKGAGSYLSYGVRKPQNAEGTVQTRELLLALQAVAGAPLATAKKPETYVLLLAGRITRPRLKLVDKLPTEISKVSNECY